MKVTVADLQNKTDDELMALLGLDGQLEEFKTALAEGAKLEGKAKTKFEEKVQRMFTPHIYPSELQYAVKDAQREASGKTEACCCSPDILD